MAIETDFTPHTVCPHCGYEDTDCWELSGNSGVTDCPECGEGYAWEAHHEVSYSTKVVTAGDPE